MKQDTTKDTTKCTTKCFCGEEIILSPEDMAEETILCPGCGAECFTEAEEHQRIEVMPFTEWWEAQGTEVQFLLRTGEEEEEVAWEVDYAPEDDGEDEDEDEDYNEDKD